MNSFLNKLSRGVVERTAVFVKVLIAINEDDGIERVDYSRKVTQQSQHQAYKKLNLQI